LEKTVRMRKNLKRVEEMKDKLERLKPVLRERFSVKTIGVFGSYIRGEEREDSDLDILVEFEEDAELSLLDFIGLENYLSEELGVKVDLVEKNTLKPRIGKRILEEVEYL
jgi:predicted nucleotidyltransferase